MNEYLYFQVQTGPVMTVRFTEAELLDAVMIAKLEEQLMRAVETETPQKLLLDFSDVSYCSTALINTMLRLTRLVSHEYGGQLKVGGMSSKVRSSLEMLNLIGTVFDVYDTSDEAKAAFE